MSSVLPFDMGADGITGHPPPGGGEVEHGGESRLPLGPEGSAPAEGGFGGQSSDRGGRDDGRRRRPRPDRRRVRGGPNRAPPGDGRRGARLSAGGQAAPRTASCRRRRPGTTRPVDRSTTSSMARVPGPTEVR